MSTVIAGQALPGAERAPAFLQPLIVAATTRPLEVPAGVVQDDDPGHTSAILIAFADDGPAGPDVLLTVRAADLRRHAGQPAFPGGRLDPGESVLQAALREADEEVGLEPESVTPILQLRELSLRHTGFRVTPVVAYWDRPHPVSPRDPRETAQVMRIPVSTLLAPEHRGWVQLSTGLRGIAYEVDGVVVWGFTALVLNAVLNLAGWTGPEVDRPLIPAGHHEPRVIVL